MKKIVNKGLIYQWFCTTKLFIILGLIAFGFQMFNYTEGTILSSQWDIRTLSPAYCTTSLINFSILVIIFIGIHVVSQGLNKRSKDMFLASSPFTAKQIKYNEIICLAITINLFVLMYIYMAFMCAYRHPNLMQYINGYTKMAIFNVIRIYLIGGIGILALVILNSIFTNNIFSLISMFLLYLVTTVVIENILNLQYFVEWDGISIYEALHPEIYGDSYHDFNIMYRNKSVLFHGYFDANGLTKTNTMLSILTGLVIIAILFVIYSIMTKKTTLGYSTKIFSSKANGKIITYITSLGAASFISTEILRRVYYSMKSYTNGAPTLFPTYVIAIDIVLVLIGTFIINKIIEKLLNKIG